MRVLFYLLLKLIFDEASFISMNDLRKTFQIKENFMKQTRYSYICVYYNMCLYDGKKNNNNTNIKFYIAFDMADDWWHMRQFSCYFCFHFIDYKIPLNFSMENCTSYWFLFGRKNHFWTSHYYMTLNGIEMFNVQGPTKCLSNGYFLIKCLTIINNNSSWFRTASFFPDRVLLFRCNRANE